MKKTVGNAIEIYNLLVLNMVKINFIDFVAENVFYKIKQAF